jgi:hypothetical protein
MIFVVGFSALSCLRHLISMTWIASGQVMAALRLWRNPASPLASDASVSSDSTWMWKEAGGLLLVCAILLPVFQAPYQ